MLNDEMPGYTYSRIDNPARDAFARAVAALEGVNLPRWPAAQAFASGMAAISGVFWTFAPNSARVVASSAVYGGTYSFLRNVLSRFGVETVLDFEITDLDQVRAALRPTTRIIYAETIANPTTAVADLRKLAELAHDSRRAAGGGFDVGPPRCVPAARARGQPGHPLGHQVHRRPLRRHGRGGHRADRADQQHPRRAGGHRRVAVPGRGVPAAPGAWRRCRCGCGGPARRLRCSPRRCPGTRPCSGVSTTPGCPSTPGTRWRGGCLMPGRRACASARSSR